MQDLISYFKNSKKNLVNLLLLAIMVLALPLGVNLVREQQLLKSRAAGDPIKFTGANVEKRGDKWVAKSPQVTLELVSSLGGPSGGAGSAARSTSSNSSNAVGNASNNTTSSGGSNIPIGGTASTWQSPDMKFQSKVPKDVNQIIAGAGGKSDWSSLYNYADQVVGHMGAWLTPQQANEFMNRRTDIKNWWQEGSGKNSSGISPFFEPPDAVHAWLPGALKPNGDKDGLQLLVDIAHKEDGQGISNPDQILAMFPDVKKSIISQSGGPEGSDGWPATCFLREWMKIGPNDPNAKLAQKIMQQMPGQVGFDDGVFQRGCDRFRGKSTSLPASPNASRGGLNLMSLLPKGLVKDAYAIIPGGGGSCSYAGEQGPECNTQWCPNGDACAAGHQYCVDDGNGNPYWGDCSQEIDYCGSQCSGSGGSGGGGGSCQTPADYTIFERCTGCSKAAFSCYIDSERYETERSVAPNGQCASEEWCGGGSGGGGGQCDTQGSRCWTQTNCYQKSVEEICGSNAYCDQNSPGTYGDGCVHVCAGYYQNRSDGGVEYCAPGKIVNDTGTCGWDPNKSTTCTVTGGGPGPGPGPGPGGGPPGDGTKVCTPNLFKPFDKNDCTGQRVGCNIDAGEFRVFTCKADGSGYVESGSECKLDCKTATGGGPGGSPGPSGQPSGRPSSSPATSGRPSTSPSTAPSSSPPSGGGTITTVSFKIVENPDELASAQEFAYNSEPVVTGFTFRNQTPGDKFVWVEFKASNGRTARHNLQIKLLGADPRVLSCSLDFEGTNAVFNIKGQNFGAEQGSAKTGTNNLQVRDWKDSEVKLIFQNPQSGQSFPVTLTNTDGQTASAQCGSVSGLSLGAKVFCRAPSKHDTDNVDLVLTGVAGSVGVGTSGSVGVGSTAPSQTGPIRQKVKIDKDGNIQNLQSKLAEGSKYKVSLKAPKSLRKTVEIIAGGGTTNLQNFVLPVGDIFPLDGGDGKINNFDKSELNRQWIIAQSSGDRSGDFNQDGRVNSIDWACMRFDFNKEDEKE